MLASKRVWAECPKLNQLGRPSREGEGQRICLSRLSLTPSPGFSTLAGADSESPSGKWPGLDSCLSELPAPPLINGDSLQGPSAVSVR